jgi:hypothetical protein
VAVCYKAAVVLYDRPVADLMSDAPAAMPDRFEQTDIVDWFAQHYPKVNPKTVRQHVRGLTANDRTRKHMPSLARRQPLFVKIANRWLELFDPDIHLGAELNER